jgi:hypothetical protein
MSNDDILQMARESGLHTHKEVQPELLRFARLVAEAERESCAKVCEERASYYDRGDDDGPESRRGNSARSCAYVIRARKG